MVTKPPDYVRRIVRNPQIMVGKPVVKGTRIPVERVIQHLAYSLDIAEVIAAYPEITIEDIQACLAFASAAVAGYRQEDSQEEVPNRHVVRV
jgi:uncharacterized protein (DUF433 family)